MTSSTIQNIENHSLGQSTPVLPLSEAARLVSLNPAQAAGFTDRGSLQVGKRADLVLLQVGERPRVRATWRCGQLVYWDGHVPDLAPYLFAPATQRSPVFH